MNLPDLPVGKDLEPHMRFEKFCWHGLLLLESFNLNHQYRISR